MQKSVSKICRQYSNRLTVAGIALVFLFLGISKGMAADSIESKSISLSIQNGTIQTFVSEIEKQTDYMFLYKNEDIDNSIKVNVKAENKPAIEVLNEVIAKTNLVYKINGKHIVLTRKGSADVKDIVITGKIVDNKGEAIIGANVLIKGTSSGVVSDMDGNFSIKAPNEQSVLIFSYVGYVNQEIQIGTRRTFSITLQESSLEIDELVVTALGMKRSEKALGYATQKVSGGEFEKVKGANVATSLTGRISGLTVYNSTEFLESPTLKLRGENPILVLDGVPTNMSLGEINSDDILSIDVLKGATASALYGSRGGSGAIMVTTKKGGKEGFSVTVNTSNMFNVGTLAMPEVQTAYSAGYNGKYNTDDEVWGDKLDIGRIYPQWDPIAKEMRESELTSKGRNNFKNFLEFSMISNTNVSVTQTGKNGSVRSSFSYVHNKGQYPNAKSQQFKYSIGGEMKLGDKVSVEGTLAFNKMISPNTAGTGYGNQGYIYNLLVWTGPEYDVTQYKDYWITPDEKQNWHYEGWYDNPYLMAYEKRNTIDNNTTNGMLSLNYQITPWLKALVRSGMDVSNDQTQRRAPLGINSTRNWGGTDKGYYMEKNAYAFSMNNDFILSAEKSLDKFTFEGLLGGSIYYYKTNSLEASTKNGLSIPGFYSLKASVESPNIDVYTSKKQVNSLFGKLTVGYRNAFFLDLTGRNDWSSTLPTDDNSYFYPSVGASVLMSEIMPLPDWMNFWKLRGSWTVSKNDLDIYAINTAYAVDNAVWNGMNSAYYPTTLRGSVKP
ncbi:MAG TPA: SusC/RagA family TonB-linked outer membrane protein, partial [Macellibacteroides fermentans]|nr:SusC/RagA family TonB-linked outer membrane protein [Macellibacteroides fermentans]